MKWNVDKHLLKYCLYIAGTAIFIYIAFGLLSNFWGILDTILSIIKKIAVVTRPLIIGLIIAYLLNMPTSAIEKSIYNNKLNIRKKDGSVRFKKGPCRMIGILCSYVLVLLLVSGLIFGIYYMIGGQLSGNTSISNAIRYIGEYVSNTNFSEDTLLKELERINIPFAENINAKIVDIIVGIQDYVTQGIKNVTQSILSFGSNLISFFISFILSIYLVHDKEGFIELWDRIFFMVFRKSKLGENIKIGLSVINNVFSEYLKGQLLEAFFVGIMSSIALSIIGIDYALIIGIIAGICNMIPYVGPWIGAGLAAIIALIGGDLWKVLYSIIGMTIVQQIDNNLLAPKIVGDRVNLHPVFTMLAIIVGGSEGGLVGMLVAVPLAASFKRLFFMWYNNHIETDYKEYCINKKT